MLSNNLKAVDFLISYRRPRNASLCRTESKEGGRKVAEKGNVAGIRKGEG